MAGMTTSMRPKPRPKKPMRPKANPLNDQNSPKSIELRSTRAMKAGGKVSAKEGTAKDMREDKAMAKKRGMTMKQWESSAADKKHDAPKKMATGGSVRGTGAATRGKGFSGCY